MKKISKLQLGKSSYLLIIASTILIFVLVAVFSYSIYGARGTYSADGGFGCYSCTYTGSGQTSYEWALSDPSTSSRGCIKTIVTTNCPMACFNSNGTYITTNIPLASYSFVSVGECPSENNNSNGSYTVTLNPNGYKWNDGSIGTKTVTYTGQENISEFPKLQGTTVSSWCYDSSCSGTKISNYVDSNENGRTLYANVNKVGCYECVQTGSSAITYIWSFDKPSNSGTCYNLGMVTDGSCPTACFMAASGTYTRTNKPLSSYILADSSNCKDEGGQEEEPADGAGGGSHDGDGAGGGYDGAGGGGQTVVPSDNGVKYTETINGDRCYNGSWVRVTKCQAASVDGALCQLKDGTTVYRSSLEYETTGNCKDLTNAYSDKIDDFRCDNELSQKWIYISSCQSRDLVGAKCRTSTGTIIRTHLTEGFGCLGSKPSGSSSNSSNSSNSASNTSSNPNTGTFGFIVMLVIGVGALITSIYYFRKNKTITNKD